jgi:hypothetical protein
MGFTFLRPLSPTLTGPSTTGTMHSAPTAANMPSVVQPPWATLTASSNNAATATGGSHGPGTVTQGVSHIEERARNHVGGNNRGVCIDEWSSLATGNSSTPFSSLKVTRTNSDGEPTRTVDCANYVRSVGNGPGRNANPVGDAVKVVRGILQGNPRGCGPRSTFTLVSLRQCALTFVRA